MKNKVLTILLLLSSLTSLCQTRIVFENKSVKRTFEITQGKFRTTGQTFKRAAKEFHFGKNCNEFSAIINGRAVTARDFKFADHNANTSGPAQHLQVNLKSATFSPGEVIVELHYWLYDTLSVVRKQVVIKNQSPLTLTITDLNMEDIPMDVSYTSWSELYTNFGTTLQRMPYQGDYNDAAIMMYNPYQKTGVILGNEALSVMKRTEIYKEGFPQIKIGLAASKDTYPFKKVLKPGAAFESPKTFLCFFKANPWQRGFESDFADFTRNFLDIRLNRHDSPPLLMYNTWRPYRYEINADIIRESVDALENTGTDLFIVDDGWFDMMGNYNTDKKKFPDGIEKTFEHIRSKNMKGGLWFSFATANVASDVVRDHPEWILRDSAGKPMLVHDINQTILGEKCYTMSMASPWYDHIKNKIAGYVRSCKLSYVKLDLAAAIGSYEPNPKKSGDYGFNPQKLYTDHESSYYEIFEKTLQLCDDLHKEFPDLLLDYTYETHGRQNGVDYALLQHAEYDWITNYELPAPEGPLSIRQMLYQRARTIPVSTLLIGNQLMEEVSTELTAFTYLSLASSTAILVGDVRKMPAATKQWYKKWDAWFEGMNKKYQYMRFYQSADVFDHPTDENWDGCYRFNTEKEGGVLFFYRNASLDSKRSFRVHCVNPKSVYKITDASNAVVMGQFTGKELLEKGVTIQLPLQYSAKVLGIEKVK